MGSGPENLYTLARRAREKLSLLAGWSIAMLPAIFVQFLNPIVTLPRVIELRKLKIGLPPLLNRPTMRSYPRISTVSLPVGTKPPNEFSVTQQSRRLANISL